MSFITLGSPVGTPFTITNGALLPAREVIPRMLTKVSELTSFDVLVIFIPETFPASAFSRFCCGTRSIIADFTSPTEYPRAFFSRLMPNAVTTTSSTPVLTAISVTSMDVLLLTWISCPSIPTKENTNTDCEFGTVILYLPSKSVTTPVEVPLIITVTPGRNSPV